MNQTKLILGTTQVPDAVLSALAKRKLTNSEIRIIMAICAKSTTRPGRALVSMETMARVLGVRKETACDLVQHAADKNIIKLEKSNAMGQAFVMSVADPSGWAIPG